MKRKLSAFLALALILAMVLPTTVFAASNASTLNKLKLKNVKKYDTALPTKGTKKSASQLNKLLNKIPYKMPGKGDTTYEYYLYFSRNVSDKPGTYNWVDASKSWNKYDSKKGLSFSYTEMKNIKTPKDGTYYYLEREDSKYWYSYIWKKGEKEGIMSKDEKTSGGGSGSTLKLSNYKLYSDAKVLGQKCMVYSFYIKKNKETVYLYVSRKNGLIVKQVSVTPETLYTYLYFDKKLVKKANSFFNAPKNVNFATYTAELSNVRYMPERFERPLAS